jgi:hypothetical protein
MLGLVEIAGVDRPVESESIAPDEIVRVLEDVVGAAGLGALQRLERALRRYVVRLRAHGVPPEAVLEQVKRTVQDVLPSRTPEWSAYLLTEAVVEWSIDAYDSGR